MRVVGAMVRRTLREMFISRRRLLIVAATSALLVSYLELRSSGVVDALALGTATAFATAWCAPSDTVRSGKFWVGVGAVVPSILGSILISSPHIAVSVLDATGQWVPVATTVASLLIWSRLLLVAPYAVQGIRNPLLAISASWSKSARVFGAIFVSLLLAVVAVGVAGSAVRIIWSSDDTQRHLVAVAFGLQFVFAVALSWTSWEIVEDRGSDLQNNAPPMTSSAAGAPKDDHKMTEDGEADAHGEK